MVKHLLPSGAQESYKALLWEDDFACMSIVVCALLPSGGLSNGSCLKRIEEGYCQMLLTASCEFEFATCIELRACLGWGFMFMYLLYMQLLPLLSLLCAQTL